MRSARYGSEPPRALLGPFVCCTSGSYPGQRGLMALPTRLSADERGQHATVLVVRSDGIRGVQVRLAQIGIDGGAIREQQDHLRSFVIRPHQSSRVERENHPVLVERLAFDRSPEHAPPLMVGLEG